MGFCANLGGNLALVGSTPLIILNDVMEDWWRTNVSINKGAFTPLGLFFITPIGIVMVLGGLAYFLVIGKRLLPRRQGKEESGAVSAKLLDLYGEKVGQAFECVVPYDFNEQSLEQLELRPQHGCSVLAVAHNIGRDKILAPRGTTRVGPGDIVVLVCQQDNMERITEDLGWQAKHGFELFAKEMAPEKSGVLEAIVTSRSGCNGHTTHEFEFRKLFGVNPLAILRGDIVFVDDIARKKLKPGDALLLQGPLESLRILLDKTDLVYTESPRGEEIREEKAWLGLGALGAFLFFSPWPETAAGNSRTCCSPDPGDWPGDAH